LQGIWVQTLPLQPNLSKPRNGDEDSGNGVTIRKVEL